MPKTDRELAIEINEKLIVTERTAIAEAADYLAGPEVEAVLAKMKEFEGVSQVSSPFVRLVGNIQNAIQATRQFVIAANMAPPPMPVVAAPEPQG